MEIDDKNTIDAAPDKVEVKTQEETFTDIQDITLPQQSPNFIYGVSGWRLNSNGVIDAVGVNLSGSITPEGVIGVINGGTGAQTLTGILLGNGTNAITAISPLSASKVYYVSNTSGGTTNRKLTFTNGVLTSET